MKTLFVAACAAGAVLLTAPAAFAGDGCGSAASAATATATPNEVTLAAVHTMVEEGAVTPVDANGADTRNEFGVLPGAIMLDGDDIAGVLPADTETDLVFYCSSQRCNAAPRAAEAAIEAGYTNVHVMRDGIRGWVDAGYETQAVTGS